MTTLRPGLILEVARGAGREVVAVGRSGEFRIRCPRPDLHEHGDAHPSCRLEPTKNTFYCDVCQTGGGVKKLAELLGVSMPSNGSRKAHRATAGKTKLPLVFESMAPISPDLQRRFSDTLAKSYTAETWRAFGVLEGRVYPKGLPNEAELAIAFPLPAGGHHVYRYTRQNKKSRWCFANSGKSALITAGLDRPDPVILAEGEWDAMRAYEIGYAVATGTGAGTFRPEWATRLAGRQVVVVYDVDQAGKDGAEKALAALRSACRAWCLALPLSGNIETDGKDLSDFVAVHGAEAFLRLVGESAEPADRDAADDPAAGLAGLDSAKVPVAQLIDAVLLMDGPARIKRREAARLVIDDLSKLGHLIHAAGGRQFWFDKTERQLIELDLFRFRSFLIARYEINPAEPEFRHIMEAIRSYTLAEGRRVAVYRFSYFDQESGRLYLSAGAGRVVRLDGGRPCWINHGDDGVLFDDFHDFEVIPHESIDTTLDIGDPLEALVLTRVNFIRGQGVILGPEQQRLLLRVWILAVFFPELLPAKILLLLYGEKGSGKTTTLRVILKLLLGPSANVTPLSKEDGFNAAVSHEFLLALDNVDSFCRWIEDRLATVATGQTIRYRKLYTTNEMISFPTRCCIALTARTPRFRRDDVVDRLQILRVARLEKFSRETDWYAEIEQHRPALWAQLLRDLNAVVARLRDEQVDAPDTLRMADWGFLATTIGAVLGQEQEVKSALEAAELDKAHFLLEADELYDLLHAVANERPHQEWKAGELFAELKTRAERADVDFSIKSPRSLGRILHRLAPALKRMIRFEIRTDAHDGQAVYILGPLPGNENDGNRR